MAGTITVVAETGGRVLNWRYDYAKRRLVRDYQRTYRIITNDGNIGPLAAAFSVGLPAWGASYVGEYEFDTSALVSGYSLKDSPDNALDFLCEITFSSDVEWQLVGGEGENQGSQQNAIGNPLYRPVITDYSTRAREQPLELDYGLPATANYAAVPPQAVATAAGERFDNPPVMDEIRNDVLIIKKNTSAPPPTGVAGCTNSDSWNGDAARTWRINYWNAHQTQEEGFVFYSNEIEMERQASGWDWQPLNQGTYGLTPDGNRFAARQVDPNGLGLDGRILLAANGQPLPKTVVTSGAIAAGLNVSITVKSATYVQLGALMGNAFQPSIRLDAGSTVQEDVVVTGVVVATGVLTIQQIKNAHAANCTVDGIPNYLTFRRRSTAFTPLNLLGITG